MSAQDQFGKGSGPNAPFGPRPSFGGPRNPSPRPHSSSPLTPPPPRSSASSGWSSVPRPFYRGFDGQYPERSSSFTTFIASRDSMTSVTARVSRFPNQERTRSPISYADIDVLGNSGQSVQRNNADCYSHSSSAIDDHNHSLHSPPMVPVSHQPVRSSQGPSISLQQQALAPRTLYGQARLSDSHASFSNHQTQSSVPPYIGYQNPQQNFTKQLNNKVSRRTESPSSPSSSIRHEIAHKGFTRPSLSPPRMGTTSNVLRAGSLSQIQQKSLPSTSSVSEATASGPISSTAPKRIRSPSSFSADETLEGNSISAEDDSEREMLAKAKRLARFKVELSKSEQNNADAANQKASANKQEQSLLEHKYVGGQAMDSAGNLTNGHAASDYEGFETFNVIIGLCPDMCPESERGERERKGDLDLYERLDGDRNVTSRHLAVKKYTRTAEREASLIRPMPILQKTIDYLLSLLDRPYDERFLGVYNFLWDRMRAIRMDLRMQHIFNQGAITMLEQMIKLHIIAMHELCEYTKGEGFSEGFDAHLNIEQMNKTSVELFQLYDDHRRKGIYVPTEKEFRGYYALLKLDKHPGYKVEPAELSLDLAQMTPEIRQTPEVLFARSVARACRTGNFIAFFRLARKATYLQACLMHAHFAKLRTQALASLHSGLQNNQGLPVAHAANWLAMEDEDIEDLVEYHGFFIKTFEEPYMVKEGPFLNADNDYPTKCSKLVLMKRSRTIVEDVSPPNQVEVPPFEPIKEMRKTYKHEPRVVSPIENDSSYLKFDEEMADSAVLSPKDRKSGKAFKGMLTGVQDSGKDHDLASPKPSLLSFPFTTNIPEPQVTRTFPFTTPIPEPQVTRTFLFSTHIQEPQVTRTDILMSTNSDLIMRGSPRRNLQSTVDTRPLEIVPTPAPSESSIFNSFSVAPPVAQGVSNDEYILDLQEHGDQMHEDIVKIDKEIAEAKLKLILRLWKRRVSKLRMLREQRQLASNVALESMSLGPPIRHYINQPGNFDKFDIDIAMRERYEKQEKSLARLNVSETVASTLGRRNPDAKCLCWKIILCSQMNSGYEIGSAGGWLVSKLMPSSEEDVVISSPGLAIWRNWFSSQSGTDPTCCLSVVRDTAFGSIDETVSGASAVVFLVSENISWKNQSVHLHNLLMPIPSGARVPLLILCGSSDKGFSSMIINELGLQDIDKSRVSCFLLVFLIENQQVEHSSSFFSNQRLRDGLQWLAGESPVQPTIRNVNIRELVHSHLNSFSRVQDIVMNSKLGPNNCISLFNEALDCTVQEIIDAAYSNPAGWPCPEIGLLEESYDEDMRLKRYLPALGWSSNVKIQPIISALRNCKLPPLLDDLSWLARGYRVGHEIENQRIQLENCLIQYLTHTTKIMGVSLATKEACTTTQTCARLELCDSSYHVVPHWGMIFRRIFNWRLSGLSKKEISMAYISKCHHAPSLDPDVKFEASPASSYYLNPSLDEVISVNFDTTIPVNEQPELEALQHLPQRESNDGNHEAANMMNAENKLCVDKFSSINTDSKHGLNNANSEALMNGKPNKETDQLSKLLEQCNLIQDGIEKKLSVYF